LSSLVIIKTADRLNATDKQKPNPFYFGEVLLYPNLGEPFHKATTKELPLFITIYPVKGTAEKSLKLEILSNGKLLGNSSLSLPAPDETGRIQYATGIPLDKFQAGDYEIRISVGEGPNRIARTEKFKLLP
jgi:hypothetical protein